MQLDKVCKHIPYFFSFIHPNGAEVFSMSEKNASKQCNEGDIDFLLALLLLF